MSLSVHAVVAQRHFEAALDMDEGERVAVLGHNGAGKSTLLSILAGTLRPDSGRAVLNDELLFDLDAGRRRWRPPHERGIALLAQDALLFPHLSVRDNVAFGPRVGGASSRQAAQRAQRWLDEVGVAEFADRRPHELSGGQAQRVALARALAAEPKLLLLDEPMAALDVSVAPILRRVLRRVLENRSAIIVTHDLLDAVLLAQRIIVLQDGRVAESGPTEQVLQHPKTRFTARIAGLNLVRGSYRSGCVVHSADLWIEGNHQAAAELVESAPAAAVFSPSAVTIAVEDVHSSARNRIAVTIAELEPTGQMVRVRADDHHGHHLSADVTMRSVAELDLYPGRTVIYSVKAASVSIYPV
ncbi:molybdate transport system ATP-binding protein [Propionibacterium cyclohexanicum]|uniref:Molybdate transport system ATP-binding protein n=1 Tax=Propionibacterium cyclohexanicum TaxID=64702 RepID=A0A1H9TZ75_9ACTN|nr:ATP-binding cassette domain-containing protein [Propionibacterium cyclohexanicum]SES02264.1 molybdate transport system ATP-binding protein [Propionibacterium cyclohexanicum]